MNQKEFLDFLNTSLQQLQAHKQIANECDTDDETITLHNGLIAYCSEIKNTVESNTLAINYLQLFQNDINQTLTFLPYRNYQNFNVNSNNKEQVRNDIEKQKVGLSKQLQSLHFNLYVFQKLSFFGNNIVAIGANGSGKTTLSNKLKQYLPKGGVVISAQKILIIPTFSGISNITQTTHKLKEAQSQDKSLKVTYSTESNGTAYGLLVNVGGEFQILLDNLLAERNAVRNKFCDDRDTGKKDDDVPITKLDIALKIWNSLIQHRILQCREGINLILESQGQEHYPAYQMSDGEKVTLYLIAQILQAPENGFIIVDEPEIYLHKTILTKLWDRLEQQRPDCIFVYLTHDLDFATSRNAKKVWIKSYIHPDKWDIEDIPENDQLPEALLLELLGSRKNILFCEGEKGSCDEKIYNCLFPELTITPVGGCFSVINYTKAFNKIPNLTTKAFGLIDSDYHSKERLDNLEQVNIFSLSVAEVENLLLNEKFLKLLAQQLLKDEKEIENIKNEIISELESNIELQTSNYVSAKIDYYFKDSNVKKGNTQTEIENNYVNFTNEIMISDWYSQRKIELDAIIKEKDYIKTLGVYNNKGLRKIVEKYFKISDFTDRAIKFLQSNKEAQNILKEYFPKFK